MPGNCAFYAFDRVNQSGGYLLLRHTARRAVVPHVLHQTAGGVLTHYAPVDDTLPAHRKLWFRGQVLIGDDRPEAAQPMPAHHLLAGAWLGALLVTTWAIRHYWRTLCTQ